MLTGFGRTRRMTERAAARLPEPPDVLELDVNSADDLEALTEELRDRWGGSTAPCTRSRSRRATPSAATSCPRRPSRPRSPSAPAPTRSRRWPRRSLPLMDGGGSLVGMDFDASEAWPVYDWMGVAKAALESVNRYLARDLGEHGRPREPRLGRPGGDAGRPGHPGLRDARRPVGEAGAAGLGHLRPGPGGRRGAVPPVGPRRAASPARSSTWTAASTRWARRSGRRLRGVLLAIDVGNTQTHVGMFQDDELVEHWRFATVRFATADELATVLAGLLDLRDLRLARRSRRDGLRGRAHARARVRAGDRRATSAAAGSW